MKNLFTVVIAGSQYLLHPQKLGTIEETINPDALIPVTLLTTTEINTDLEGILQLFATVDDVFQPDFGGILVEKPEKNKTIGFVQNPAPRSRARFSLQRPEVEAAAFEDLPSGPYFLHGPNLYQAWRLYEDFLDAFTFGVIPNSINGSDDGYEALSSLSDNGSSKSIAVPSRLYHAAPSIRKPLSGVRTSVTDAASLKGVQTTLSSRSWSQLYGTEASETAEFVQKLIDMGAIIVGKTKSSQLDSGREWVDVAAPWNPRGDGYQDSGGSAAGAGASVSGYDWMEYAIAKDSFEGVREQARVHGVYSIRASAQAASLQGWRNDSQNYAAMGLLNRNLHDLLSLSQLTLNTSNANMSFPKRIIYPLDFASTTESDQTQDDKFVAMLEQFLEVKADKIRLSDAWDAHPPKEANGQTLEEYMKEAPFSSFCSDFYHEYQDFRGDYKNKFGREPYVEATPRFRWGIGENESKQDYAIHRERIEVFRKWFGDNIMPTLGDSETIMVLPFGPHTVQYRDDLPRPPSRIDGIGPEALAPLLGLPHLVIPCELFSNTLASFPPLSSFPFEQRCTDESINITVAQTSYHSRVTDKSESRPFTGSIMGPHGSDIMILQLAKAALGLAEWRSRVDTGRWAFPQGYEPE
ncbi:amidase signature domain-containing protein [Trichoderma sp. SZMC 28013]